MQSLWATWWQQACKSLLDNIAPDFYLFNGCPVSIKQHLIRFFLMKCCLKPQKQHFIRFLLYNVVPGDTLGQYCTDNSPCEVFLFLFLSVSYRILHGHFCVVQEAPHNIIQCCSWGSRQLCKRKNPVQCCFNIPGTTLQSWKPFTMLSERLQTVDGPDSHVGSHIDNCIGP